MDEWIKMLTKEKEVEDKEITNNKEEEEEQYASDGKVGNS